MSQPDLQTHEAKFYLHYAPDPDGLAPYWALGDLLINHADGFVETTVEIDGEQWNLRLNYSDCGIAPRPSDDVDRETVYEFDLTAHGYGERKVSVNFSPRWPRLQTPDGDDIDTPWQHFDESHGVEAWVQGSNLDLGEYPSLIMRFVLELAAAAGFDWQHDLDPFGGRIVEVERYLRLNYDQNRKLVGETGIMMRLLMLLAEEQGAQAEYKVDNEGRVGKNHRLMLDASDVAQVFPRHRGTWGRQLKSYLPREAESFAPDEDLYHPKVGALYRKSLSRETVDWDDRDDVVRELDETVLNALAWSDIPLDAGDGSGGGGGNGIFVSDDHFSVEPRLNTLPIYPDPTPELEAKQESILWWALHEHTQSDADVIEQLATDGGQHKDELKAATGWSDSTLYRVLDRLEGAIESQQGHFRFASRKLAREFRSLIDSFEDHKAATVKRAERLLDVEIRSNSNSTFERWLAKYGAEFVDPGRSDAPGDRPVIRIDTVLSRLKSADCPRLDDVLREMVQAWRNDRRDYELIRDAIVEVDLLRESGYRTTPAAEI